MPLEKMSIVELREYAAENEISLKGLSKKADILAAIQAANEEVLAFEEEEPEVLEAEIIEEQQTNDLAVTYTAGTLEANFAHLNEYVDSILAKYEDWEPSADSAEDLKLCANHRKYLNGLAKQIDEKRKFYKNEYLLPLNAFEADCNQVRDKIKAVANRLNDVEKQADEARKERKREDLKSYYEGYAGVLADVVPYERIEDSKWLNKQPVLEKARLELEAKVNKVASDWETLKSQDLGGYYQQAEVAFFNTLDLGAAISYAKKLKDDAAKIANMKAELDAYNEAPEVYEPAPIPLPSSPPSQEFEPFDPMTCEPEHRAVYPEPIPQTTPEPPQNQTCDAIAQLLSVYPESKLQNVLEALKTSQKETIEPMEPYVMVINEASVSQLRAVGKLCGLIGVTGVFKRGTLQQAASAAYMQPLQMGA